MDHRLRLAIALVIGTGACGEKEQGKPAPPVVAPDAAPPPPVRTGQARLVNLYVGAAGEHLKVDVWAKRSFDQPPVQLAGNLDYGAVSAWFSPPEHVAITVVAAGAGPDAAALGGMSDPTVPQRETGTLAWMRQTGAASVSVTWDAGDPTSPAPPPAGKGVLVLRADSIWEHERELTPTTGGVAFFVGDGSGKCLHQRVEDDGFAAASLGGTNPVVVDLAPGKHRITLHRWPGKPCKTPVALELEVTIAAGQGVLAFVHSPDSKHLEVLQTPLGL